jgi:hypothetical protein
MTHIKWAGGASSDAFADSLDQPEDDVRRQGAVRR